MTREERAKQLREALKNAKRTGSGRPYPDALRRAALDYQKECEDEGVSVCQVAAELGIAEGSLVRWSRALGQSGELFRAIEIVPEPTVRASGIIVHSPRGLRVEGLTVQELAELLTRLS